MGRKVEGTPHWTLYERRFERVTARPTLRGLLTAAREHQHLLDYSFEDGGLIIRRGWVDGLTLDEMFRRIPAADRARFSAEAFAKLLRQLDALRAAGLEHGAVHPGNVIISRGVQLIDVIANSSRLGVDPGDDGYYPIWTWAPTAPGRRGWGRWDRISLLRTCSMLALGEEAWHAKWTAPDMLEACARWVKDTRPLFEADAEAAVRIETTLAMARRLVGGKPLLSATSSELQALQPEELTPAADPLPPVDPLPHLAPAEPTQLSLQPTEITEPVTVPEDPSEIPDSASLAVAEPETRPAPSEPTPLREPQDLDTDAEITDSLPVPAPTPEPPASPEGATEMPPRSADTTGRVEPPPDPAADLPVPDPRDDPVAFVAVEVSRVRGNATDAILRTGHEAAVIQQAVRQGLTPERARSAMAEWLEGENLIREEILHATASRTISDGRHFGNWVRMRALIMAEWLYTSRGEPEDEARSQVRQIVAEHGLQDERAHRREWVRLVDRYLRKNCPRLSYKPRQLKKMIDLVARKGIPTGLAERWVERYLREMGYERKDGWF